jgi:GDP-4-dehydro-6-deoxy-D-mannose reductase
MARKTILITGISGFVGGHYSSFILNRKRDWTIHGISRSYPAWDFLPELDTILDAIHFHKSNLLHEKNTNKLVKEIDPDYILHLAAFSSVADSWKEPRAAFLNNTNAFLNLVESVRLNNTHCRILSVGSSEEYGIVDTKDLPLTESHYNRPSNPYAVARVSQENLSNIYTKGYNLDICCTRSFNHIGPGQHQKYVVSSIAKQFAEITIKKLAPVIKIGDGTIIRDFIDIDDVVRAYDAIFTHGQRGEVYNVCSGNKYSISKIIRIYSDLKQVPVRVIQNKNLVRPIDNPVLFGDYQKLKDHSGWEPVVPIKKSLLKLFDYWSNRL